MLVGKTSNRTIVIFGDKRCAHGILDVLAWFSQQNKQLLFLMVTSTTADGLVVRSPWLPMGCRNEVDFQSTPALKLAGSVLVNAYSLVTPCLEARTGAGQRLKVLLYSEHAVVYRASFSQRLCLLLFAIYEKYTVVVCPPVMWSTQVPGFFVREVSR